MMKSKLYFILAVSLILFSAFHSTQAHAQMTADEIVKKVDQLLKGDSSIGVSSMKIVNPKWTRTMEMKYWSKGKDDFFIHITAPAREAGTTFLKQKNNLYQYLPTAEMRIKISPSMMNQSWMGSDFTNDDLVRDSDIVNDYFHKLLGSEKVDEHDTYKIELTPKPQVPVVWDKIILWARKTDFVPIKQDFFNEKGEKVRTMTFSDIKNIGDRNYPMTWTIIPVNKPGHQTTMTIKSLKINTPIPGHVFTLQNLEKPR
jgi:outer membrane lipoprotein-sorting protein